MARAVSLALILAGGLAAILSPLAASACPEPEPCQLPAGAYRALMPPDRPPQGVLLFLHGWGGTAEGMLGVARIVEPALARGYAVVAPQGAPRRDGDAGGAWNAVAEPGRRDDVAFLRAVLDDASARFAVPRGRVLAAGFSGGGMMVWRLACDAPESAAAFAPIAGLLWRPLPVRCAGPVRLLHAHGWRDEIVPMEGRAVADGRLVQGDLFDGLALLRAANGCAADAPDLHDGRGPFLRRFWTSCAPGAALGLALFDEGHRTPEGWADMALDWFEEVAPPLTAP